MNIIRSHIEVVAAVVIVGVLAVLLSDASDDMSMAASGAMVTGLVLAVVTVIAHVMSSKPRDEREQMIMTKSNSIAYVIGLVLLTVQIGVDSLNHELGEWPPFILASMILAKLGVSYLERNR